MYDNKSKEYIAISDVILTDFQKTENIWKHVHG